MTIFLEVLIFRMATPGVNIRIKPLTGIGGTLRNCTGEASPRDKNLKICLFKAETIKV